MILSFHPCFEADRNILCAGRKPGAGDLAAIKEAKAVILPQGCTELLYRMARGNCDNVFPNYDMRFDFPGKSGQIRLFRKIRVAHPKTEIYTDVNEFYKYRKGSHKPLSVSLPFVFKFNWGGEGDNVSFLDSPEALEAFLEKAVEFERTGQKGFILQTYIPSRNRSLRVVVIGSKIISYWRIQKNKGVFCANLNKGAVLDHDSDPRMQQAARSSAQAFCDQTGINLAGFDFLFPSGVEKAEPLFLEINYFFGRSGLGGSENYYGLLGTEINRWLSRLSLPNIIKV